MPECLLTRRAALVSLGAGAAVALSGCNTTQAPAVQTQTATPSRLSIGDIEVNTAPLLAQSGNPTAMWVQQALPGQLAQAFGVSAGGAGGATLRVRINSVYLGGGGPADPDRMRGVATLNGVQTRLRAERTHTNSPTEQALPEQALQGWVTELSQVFAYSLARKMGA